MIDLTIEEKNLFALYRYDTIGETVAVIREALKDIIEPEDKAATVSLIHKLEEYCDECETRWDCFG